MSILDAKPGRAIESYLDDCARVGADREVIRDLAVRTLKHLNGDAEHREATEIGQALERRWYESLSGKPDWDVYATDYYLAELWACWVVYSRSYLRLFAQHDRVMGRTFLQHLGPVREVLDLGCGVGLTTAALKQIFPDARVVGTNLDGTRQIELARLLAERHGFEIATEPQPNVDFVFASEYFEHFPSPVRHLQDVLRVARPRALLVANAFGTRAIGHFPRYYVRGCWQDGTATKREFAKEMRARGYRKIKTAFWNNRPTYWRRR